MGNVAQVMEVVRTRMNETRIVEEEQAAAGPGEVVLRIDAFALTANNITYGVAGDMLGYWQFFPAADEGWGRIPVWGFADVQSSGVEGIAPGERYYGFLPMASHLRVEPVAVSENGFSDGAAHRKDLPGVYNQYVRCARDPLYQRDQEATLMLFRPLFTTSYFLDDFLSEQAFFGARSVLLSSASSKTAFGLAWLLHERHRERVRVLGLTSEGNSDWVRSLGCYDAVLEYPRLEEQLAREPTVYVDMAGNRELRARIHHHLQQQLGYSCAVGITHWESAGGEEDTLPGPQPELFFAPNQVRKRVRDWGQAGVNARLAEVWKPFAAQVHDWVTVRREAGPQALSETYLALLQNHAAPASGYILHLD